MKFAALYCALCVCLLSVSVADFPYGSEKVRGVNLGGWFVLESWIKPSLFSGLPSWVVDEWTFCQYHGKTEAKNILTQHWNTWVTEADIATIASYGLNHVRVPIGYWAFDIEGDEPFVDGQWPYVQTLVGWVRKHNLKIIFDLHGVPGSQNGFDNSGRQGAIEFTKYSNNVARARKVIQMIASLILKNGYQDVITAVELVNEPANWGLDMGQIKQFYYDGYGMVRFPNGPVPTDTLLVIHDAFENLHYWDNFMPPPKWQNVSIDTHQYWAFEGGYSNSDQILSNVCVRKQSIATAPLWTIVGEWSLAIQNPNIITGDPNVFKQKFAQLQLDAWETSAGWVFWNFKIEQGYDEWDFTTCVQKGWIPIPLTNRQYHC